MPQAHSTIPPPPYPPYQCLHFHSVTFTPGLWCLPQYHHPLVVQIIDNPSTAVRLHFDPSRASRPPINLRITVRPKKGMLGSLFHGLWARFFHFHLISFLFIHISLCILSSSVFPFYKSKNHPVFQCHLPLLPPPADNTITAAKSFSRCIQWCLPRVITPLGFHPHVLSGPLVPFSLFLAIHSGSSTCLKLSIGSHPTVQPQQACV